MKTFAAAAAVAIALVPSVFGLTINTPTNVVECQPFQFTWSGGTPPYFLSLILSAADPTPIKQFPEQQGTSFSWLVDLQANTNFNAVIKDNTGAQAFSAMASIVSGSDTSCLNTAVLDSGSGTASVASSTTSETSSSQTASSTSSASGSSPSKTNAATVGSSVSTFGIAGLFGLVGAALF